MQVLSEALVEAQETTEAQRGKKSPVSAAS
jgi:hypothetical protein